MKTCKSFLKMRRHVKKALSRLILIVFLPGYTLGQSSPTAPEILDRYVAVTGGREAYDNIENRFTRSKVEILGSNIKMIITVIAQKPDQVRVMTDSPVTGRVVSGCNGEIAWENSDIKGPVIKKGIDRENALFLNRLDRLAYWKQAYRKVSYKGTKKVEGRHCFVVEAEPFKADHQTLYFDRESGLLVSLEMVMEGEMGRLPLRSWFDDYREVDGIWLPFETRVMVATQIMISRVVEISHNIALENDFFAIPSEVQELLEELSERKGKGERPKGNG